MVFLTNPPEIELYYHVNVFFCFDGKTRLLIPVSESTKANWFASGGVGFLTAVAVVVVVLFCRFVDCVSLALKSPYGK